MNVFLISPGRTATTALASAFQQVPGYTSGHESRSRLLGVERVNYPDNHFECDNRLVWFLPRLTERFGEDGILVIVKRELEDIASSYNERWYKINMMKAYSQGILLRRLSQNGIDVCRDYVENVYEHLDYFKAGWNVTIELSLEDAEVGVGQILKEIGREGSLNDVLEVLSRKDFNLNKSGFKHKASVFKFNAENLFRDLFL